MQGILLLMLVGGLIGVYKFGIFNTIISVTTMGILFIVIAKLLRT